MVWSLPSLTCANSAKTKFAWWSRNVMTNIVLCIVYFTKLFRDDLICNFPVWHQDRFASLKQHIYSRMKILANFLAILNLFRTLKSYCYLAFCFPLNFKYTDLLCSSAQIAMFSGYLLLACICTSILTVTWESSCSDLILSWFVRDPI